ncbi:Oidioi.mRNA.OKI2018_I69.chr2.g4327.t1.cds [Oikopleura dioica]|uniref:Complex I intermediate-associated protein 30, mitochondrial n=1 Tax=Oikopleura dioica TaxID=34765 RepID=A0ABN7SX07_OIKDI|nr:Oidioi.mRNA.OKI2018_I69.chr2.g4327.t1.cds [Oikopleura dioica]
MQRLKNIFSAMVTPAQSVEMDPSIFFGSKWWTINDNVMGGVSTGKVEKIDEMLKFTGQLSNDFNGGFASCRTKFKAGTMKGFKGIEVEVKGSARTFQARFNPAFSTQLGRYSRGSYMTTFDVTEEWQLIRIPFEKTTFDWKGHQIKDVPKIKPETLVGCGFLLYDQIYDKPFELYCKNMKGYK